MPAPSFPSTVADALNWTETELRQAGVPTPRAEAEWLLADLLHTGRASLPFRRETRLDPHQLACLRAAVNRRCRRIPLQQILGETEFYSLPFRITPHVLIPRPETEILVETLADRLSPTPAPRILDIGVGSGAIAIALAHTLPQSRVIATDISEHALRLARENARLNRVSGRIALLRSDLLTALLSRSSFHALVSNPPYIPSADLSGLQPEVRDHEPRIALDGGPDGLSCHRPIIRDAPGLLYPGGWLALEVADSQASRVEALIQKTPGLAYAGTVRDLAGVERIVLACKPA